MSSAFYVEKGEAYVSNHMASEPSTAGCRDRSRVRRLQPGQIQRSNVRAERHPGSGVAQRQSRSRRIQRRSEEHTSELQSQSNLVCRLLLEKKTNQYSEVV